MGLVGLEESGEYGAGVFNCDGKGADISSGSIESEGLLRDVVEPFRTKNRTRLIEITKTSNTAVKTIDIIVQSPIAY